MQAIGMRHDGWKPRLLALFLGASVSLPLSAQDEARLFTPNFRDANIEEVLQMVFEATGRSIIPDSRLRGMQVTFLNQRAMTADELWQAFLQILQSYQYAAVESEGIWRIVPDATARTEASPLSGGAGAELATRYVTVENVNSAQLVPVLRPLMNTAIGNVMVVPGTNTMVLTDRADNMGRIVEIIRVLDAESAQATEVLSLQYAAAEDVTQKLSQLIAAQASAGAAVTLAAIPDERTNSVVLAGTPDQIARFRPLVQALDLPATQGGGSEVRYLYYADAEELASSLQSQFGGAQVAEDAETATDPTGGNINVWADVGTNALVMRAPSQVLRDMLAIVDALDIPRAQVHIQAIIVEMSETRAAEFGLTWALGNEEGDSIAGLTNFTATTGGILQLAQLGQDDSPDPGLIRDGLTAAIGNVTDSGTSWAAVISALQGDAQTNVVQLPNVTVLDNTEATIEVGQEVPFVTGSYAGVNAGQGAGGAINPFQTTERNPVGTLLTITPRINEGTGVQMDISQEVSSISESDVASDVITNRRSIETSVYVDDGHVLVLGGLMDDQLREGEEKVPWFGNIPGLGWLFRARDSALSNTVMMVFIRPTILRDSLAASALTNERYQMLLDEQARRAEEPIQLMKDAERPALPPLEALQAPDSASGAPVGISTTPPVPTE